MRSAKPRASAAAACTGCADLKVRSWAARSSPAAWPGAASAGRRELAMKRTGAQLAIYALEQIGVRFTFGIPGVQNTELYDELDSSNRITPILVTHEGGAAFMADAVSRLSSSIGTLVIVPAAGLTHAARGLREAVLSRN